MTLLVLCPHTCSRALITTSFQCRQDVAIDNHPFDGLSLSWQGNLQSDVSCSSDFEEIADNSEVRDNQSHGVLKLTLHDDSYDWEFVAVGDDTFTDTATGECH